MVEENRELIVTHGQPLELSVTDVIAQVQKIQAIMKQVMQSGEHYGVIPGTNKPSLLKPGAEKLCFTFRLDPQYESVERYDGDHLTIKSKCVLYHLVTGNRMGSGEGSCSTKETKYAYRNASLSCPRCGKEAIIKGRAEYGGGWLCFAKKGGCGAKFMDEEFEGAEVGKVANDNLADAYNTVLKMANKRSLVAAVLNATAASDIFTQDMEDALKQPERPNEPPAAQRNTKPAMSYKAVLWEKLVAFKGNSKDAGALLLEMTGKRFIANVTELEAKDTLAKLDAMAESQEGPLST